MSAQTPPTPAQAEILGPGSRITRRAEIYNSDGTLFATAPNMTDGSVSVSYDRDERRSIDVTFDNTDKSLAHYPGGFWYDKVLKIYRGVTYNDSSDLPTLIIADGAQNYYKMDEASGNLVDQKASHAGTVNGTPTFAQPGRLGGSSAIRFPTNADYFSMGDQADLSFTNNVFTLEFEAMIPAGGGGATYYGIAHKGTNIANQYEFMLLANYYTASFLNLQIYTLAGAGVLNVGVPYAPGVWAHYAFVGDGITCYCYKDGVLAQSGAFGGTWANGTGAFELGRAFQGGTGWTSCTVDNFATYSKALTPVQVAAHAAASMTGLNKSLLSWETQVGEFLIDQIDSQNFPHTIHVTGRDYAKKLLVSKFIAATAFSQGQYVIDVIKTIATNGGISKFIWPVTTDPLYVSQLGKSWAWERGTERWKAMKDLTDAFGFEIYFDNAGNLVLRTFRDPVTSPESFTFTTGSYGNLATFKKSTRDSRIYNHIVVTGEATDTIPAFGEAYNDQPDSPTNRTKLGDRVYQYSSSFITTNAQAVTVAQNFLKLHALEEYDLGLESIVIPWLEVGEIIEFLDPDPNPGDPTRFLMTDLSIPLALGAMSVTGKRVGIVL